MSAAARSQDSSVALGALESVLEAASAIAAERESEEDGGGDSNVGESMLLCEISSAVVEMESELALCKVNDTSCEDDFSAERRRCRRLRALRAVLYVLSVPVKWNGGDTFVGEGDGDGHGDAAGEGEGEGHGCVSFVPE